MTRGKGEGSVYRQKNGLWAAAITLPDGPDGKRRRKVIRRKDKKALLDEMRRVQDDLAKHGDLPTSGVTLERWLTHWLKEIAPHEIRPKTLAGYASVVNGHVIPALGKKRLDAITADDVRRLHRRMLATPKLKAHRRLDPDDVPDDAKMLSSTYALNAHNILSSALKQAKAEGKVRANVCDVVKAPPKSTGQRKALTTAQAIQLLAYCATIPDGPLWATYLLTGARRGELIGLEIDRTEEVIDLSWQLLRITNMDQAPSDYERRNVRGNLWLVRPKSDAGWRIVPKVEPIASIVGLAIAGRADGFVFLNADGEPWDPDAATDRWAEVMAEAGLPADVVLHGSRHTTVDLLYEAGVPEAVIQEIVGHSTRAVTRGYRSKGNRPILEDAMRKMAALVAPEQGH